MVQHISTLAHTDAPARGAQLSQVIPASVVAVVALVLLGLLSVRHLRGTFQGFRRVAAVAESRSGLPGWAALPTAMATVSLLVASFGFYWDVSWHIDRGRDAGPLANPAHYFIILGLAGLALAGWIAVLLGTGRPTGTSVRIRSGWHAPVGGVLLLLCGAIALAGFPLDDVWHTLFGQDVTLWGPTHIQMIGGASLATLAMWALVEEGRRDRRRPPKGPVVRWIVDHQIELLGGAFLLGLSTLQGEFDFGVPQFRQLYQPVMIMLAASMALVAVRVRGRPGSALGAALFFLAIRGLLSLLIGPVLGRTTLHFPLFLVEAALVELVALRVAVERQITFGAISGALIGSVGLAAEWGWSHLWMPLPWPAALLPEAAAFGFAAAVAGGVIGGLIGRALSPLEASRQPSPRLLVAAVWTVTLAAIAIPAPMTAHTEYRADIRLIPAQSGAAGRWATAAVTVHPADAADQANWFNVTSWQGAEHTDGGLVLAPMERIGDGTYRTERPFPVYGQWKSLLRLQDGWSLEAVPIYLPADSEIPAPRVPALPHFTRSFQPDKRILQREAVGGSLGLERVAYGVLGAIGIAWVVCLAWGLRRLDREAAAQVRGRPGYRAAA
jgi:hypothetical protein